MAVKNKKAVGGFPITLSLSAEQVADLLVLAFEGGSIYWYNTISPVAEQILSQKSEWVGWCNNLNVPIHLSAYWYAWAGLTSEGINVFLHPEEAGGEQEKHVLNRFNIMSGVQALVNTYPKRLVEILTEDYDADTADTFLQCCLFGEVVYG